MDQNALKIRNYQWIGGGGKETLQAFIKPYTKTTHCKEHRTHMKNIEHLPTNVDDFHSEVMLH